MRFSKPWWLVCVLPILACNLTRGNGTPAEEGRNVEPFEGVRTEDVVEVHVSLGDAPSVRLRCDANLLGQIETETRSGWLVIRTRRGVTLLPRAECRADIVATHLLGLETTGSADAYATGAHGDTLELRSSGSGDLDAQDVAVGELTVETSGSGDAFLAGDTSLLSIDTTGSGDVHARDLTADDAYITSTGSGDVEATVMGTAEISTTGSGDVDVWGAPEVTRRESTGSGDIALH